MDRFNQLSEDSTEKELESKIKSLQKFTKFQKIGFIALFLLFVLAMIITIICFTNKLDQQGRVFSAKLGDKNAEIQTLKRSLKDQRKKSSWLKLAITQIQLSASKIMLGKTWEEAAKFECYAFAAHKRNHTGVSQRNTIIYETMYKQVQVEGVTRLQLEQYEAEKELIEWVRSKVKPENRIIYDSPVKGNILNILMLASLVPKGILALVEEELNQKLNLNLKLNNIPKDRIIFLKNDALDSYQEANIIITSNSALLSAALGKKVLDHAHVLAYLESPEVIYQLEVKYILRRISSNFLEPCHSYTSTNFTDILINQNLSLEGLYQIEQQGDLIYIIWLEGYAMSDNRLFCLKEIWDYSQMEIKLITESNLQFYIKPEQPLHKSYEFLSVMHKNDYVQAYIMHFYGGGFTDIKHVHFDWIPFFSKMRLDSELYAIGQSKTNDASCLNQDKECDQASKKYFNINENGHYIVRKQTQLTEMWLNDVNNLLEIKYEDLKKNPARFSRESLDSINVVNQKKIISKYPIRSGQMHRAILTRIMLRFKDKIALTMPNGITFDYQ